MGLNHLQPETEVAMFHLTLFGGTDVKLDGRTKLIITCFGGTDVHRQTLAKRILREKHMAETELKPLPTHPPEAVVRWALARQRQRRTGCFIFTMFGAVEIKPPSLAEEFMDMRELIGSGLIKQEEWDRLVGRIYEMGESEGHASFTMFGALEESTLSEDEELQKIRSAQELGMISADEENALRNVVGRDPHQVRQLLRQTAFS
jgi:hypothetical protein